MTPNFLLSDVHQRDYYDDNCDYDSNGRCYSRWSYWGRWVFLAIVLVVIILLLFTLGCVNSRRRRQLGMQPVYGTAWMAPPKYTLQNPNAYQPPPPQYTPQPAHQQNPQYTGQTFNPSDGYYGGHENIQLQQPANSYQRSGTENVYTPPPGPPPNKS